MPGKPLTLHEKESIKALLALGETCNAVGVEVGRDRKTIKKFAEEPEVAESIQEKKQELADMFESLARKMLASITEADIEKINSYQRVIASGICTDKYRLLSEKSTANISSISQIAISLEEKLRIKREDADE